MSLFISVAKDPFNKRDSIIIIGDESSITYECQPFEIHPRTDKPISWIISYHRDTRDNNLIDPAEAGDGKQINDQEWVREIWSSDFLDVLWWIQKREESIEILHRLRADHDEEG